MVTALILKHDGSRQLVNVDTASTSASVHTQIETALGAHDVDRTTALLQEFEMPQADAQCLKCYHKGALWLTTFWGTCWANQEQTVPANSMLSFIKGDIMVMGCVQEADAKGAQCISGYVDVGTLGTVSEATIMEFLSAWDQHRRSENDKHPVLRRRFVYPPKADLHQYAITAFKAVVGLEQGSGYTRE